MDETFKMFNSDDDDAPSSKKAKIESSSSDEDENLTYEQLREIRIKKNMALLDILEVSQAAETFAKSIKKTQPKKHFKKKNNDSTDKIILPRRITRSMGTLSTTPIESEIIETSNNDDNKSFESDIDALISIPEEDSKFFEKLSDDLAIKEAVNDFHSCDFERFTNVVKSLEMTEPPIRVIGSRIYSLAIHPSETSLITVAGGSRGNIGIFNKKESDTREYHVHSAPVNCLSFCTWNPYKFYSTSHDGSVRCGDISNRTFEVIYKTPEKSSKNIHATWHAQYGRNELIIGYGSGSVDLIDLRISKNCQKTCWCHTRSVRTVQFHPVENHFFLTSSGIGEASLFDMRNMTEKKIMPVLQYKHSRSLTSAFFSASGTNMVSTSNDNFIRIFNTSKFDNNSTKPVKEIGHNNHTGRWLSVFKAKWHPGRDDAFFVGSMLNPKRLQIYQPDGQLLHNLYSENMTTYCPVIAAHPSQAIYVGGNSSGRIHIFSTEQQFM